MLRRRNMETAESSGELGGWPRPSFRGQRWQERALNSGPRPSAEGGDDGARTPGRRNRPLPILKSSSRSKLMLAELCEKALLFTACCEVVAPPGNGSKASGRPKSVVGATTAAMRAVSSAVGPAARAADPIPVSMQARSAALKTCITPRSRCRTSGRRPPPGGAARRSLEHGLRVVKAVGALELDGREVEGGHRALDRAGLVGERLHHSLDHGVALGIALADHLIVGLDALG